MTEQVEQVLHHKAASLQQGKGKWATGSLAVTRTKLTFSGDASASVALSDVSGIKKATGKPIIQVAVHSGRPCIFQFASLEDREALLATLIPLKDEAAKARPAAPAQSSLVPSDAVKAKVFEMHPHLADLHKRLVTAGSLTALEFWASKRREVRAAAAALKGPQSTGISTSLLDFMNRPQDPKTGRVNVTITPEVEKQIFAETPGLRHAYAVSVPHRRTRAEFFSEFFKMLQNRIERRRKKAAGTLTANDELLNEFEEEVARSAQRGSDAARPEKRARLAAADPSVNLVTEQHDGFSAGYGTRHGPGREGEGVVREGVQANDIAAELNQHASVVLAGRAAGGDGGEGAAGAPVADVEARSRSALEDLRRPEKAHYAPLSIKDPQKYFVYAEATPVATATPTSNAASSGPDMDPVRACRHIVDAYEALAADDLTAQSGAPPPMAAADAMTAAQEILAAAQGDGGVDEAGRRRNPVAALHPDFMEHLRTHVLATNELLRHFWRAQPIDSKAKANKARRVVSALEATFQECEAMQQAAGAQDRAYMAQMLRPSMDAMDRVFGKFDEWQASQAGPSAAAA